MLKVSDATGYSKSILEVNVLPVNDAPVIADYSPKGAIKLIEDTNKLFSITASDVDKDALEIKWFLDNLEVKTGNAYTFNQSKGTYNLTVSVTDNLSAPVTKI